MIHHIVKLIVLLAFLSFPACGRPEYTGEELTIIDNVNIFAGSRTGFIAHRAVVIRDEKIDTILAAGEFRAGDGVKLIDAGNGFLIPGLIDMHSHVTVLLPSDHGLEYDAPASAEALLTHLRFGVTTVRNTAAPLEDGIALREMVKRGDLAGPEIFTAGPIINGGPFPYGRADIARTADEITDVVNRHIDAGVDMVKLYKTLAPELVAVAIGVAHERGVPVIGDLVSTSWTKAAGFGIDGVCHAASWSGDYLPAELRETYRATLFGRVHWLNEVDPAGEQMSELRELMAGNGVVWDPTLIAMWTKFYGDDPRVLENPDLQFAPAGVRALWAEGSFTADWTNEQYARARDAWPILLRHTRLAWKAGVHIVVGTDFPNPWIAPGIGLHTEMELLVEAGIPPADVLDMATLDAARALGIDHRTGMIEADREADLVLLSDNPLENIRNTRSIRMVLHDGSIVE